MHHSPWVLRWRSLSFNMTPIPKGESQIHHVREKRFFPFSDALHLSTLTRYTGPPYPFDFKVRPRVRSVELTDELTEFGRDGNDALKTLKTRDTVWGYRINYAILTVNGGVQRGGVAVCGDRNVVRTSPEGFGPIFIHDFVIPPLAVSSRTFQVPGESASARKTGPRGRKGTGVHGWGMNNV